MNKTMLLLLTVICVIVISYNPRPAFGGPGQNDAATCDVNVIVDTIIEWEGANFAPIHLAHITAQNSAPEDSKHYTLWTNCNVALSANNTTTAQLTHSRGGGAMEDTLVTKYKISTDGDGDPNTGADSGAVTASGSDDWVEYNNFLKTALVITHFNTDGSVEVTLNVQATNDTDNVADTGNYEAVQTITATWIEDN